MLRRVTKDVVADAGLERVTFRDDKLELFVWTRREYVKGFELCYAIRTPHEWSMRWTDTEGVSFHRADPESCLGGVSGRRVMEELQREIPPVGELETEFVRRSSLIDERIRHVVLQQLALITNVPQE